MADTSRIRWGEANTDALQRLDSKAGRDEESLLKPFDGHLARIQKVAGEVFFPP